jgi:hypothetical protein
MISNPEAVAAACGGNGFWIWLASKASGGR